MKTTHLKDGNIKKDFPRPLSLPFLTEDDFCKAKYSQLDRRCYTARLLDIFLDSEAPFVDAYKEFRLASMDYLYKHHRDDHCSTGADRALAFNTIATDLGYVLVVQPKETL